MNPAAAQQQDPGTISDALPAQPAPAAQPLQLASAGDAAVADTFAAARARAASGSAAKDLDSLTAPAATGAMQGAAPQAAAAEVPPAPAVPLGWKILNGVGAVAKDIGLGLLTSPKQAVGGALDYVNNLTKFADSVVKKAEAAGLPNVYFRLFDNEGRWSPKMQSAEEFRQAQAEGRDDLFHIPTTGKSDTVTGDIVRTGTSFLIGRGTIAGKEAGLAQNAIADAVSGATSMDPSQPRLSNLLDSVAPNFLTNWLKAKPEDEGTLIGHLKSGLEMAGLGAAVTGIVKSLKAAKSAFQSGQEATAGAAGDSAPGAGTAGAAGSVDAQAGELADDALKARAAGPVGDLATDPLEAEFSAAGKTAGVADETAGKAAVVAKAGEGTANPPDAAARQWLADNGWPKPETGSPLSPPGEGTPTVEVSPELGAKFEHYMAQERGEIPAPLSAVEGTANADLRSADFSSTGANPVKVNLNMINGPEDLKDAISRVSSQIPAEAIRHNDAVLDAAHSMGMTADEFLAGPGGALSDNQVVGLRMVVNDVARQFLDLAKVAAHPEAGPEAKAQALAAYSKFNSIMSYMQSAKAESGRSVQAWGIPVAGSKIPYADAVARLAEVSGGPEGKEFFARMGALETPQQVAAAASAARTMSGNDFFMYGWYNALLGPRTVIKKGLSDVFMGMWNVATRYAAEKFGSGGVPEGETAALLKGYTGSFKDALQVAQAGLKAGRSQFMEQAQSLDGFNFGKVEQLAENAPQLPVNSPTFAGWDYLRSALPTSWIGAFDDFAKTVNYRAELHALAYRKAAGRGLEGAELQNAVDGLLANPPQWLHRSAVANALSNTFQDPLTGIAASIKDVADKFVWPIGFGGIKFELPVGRIVMPFIKVPVNITRWSYSNSPLPLISQSSRYAAEIAAGGATKDIALARVGLGTALATTMAGLALSGQITGRGPSDPQLRQAWINAHNGDASHSIMINGKPYSYNMVEPVGMMAAIVADTYDIMRFAKEEDAGTAAASLVFGLGEALMSKTYLSGVADLFKALENPDRESANYVNRLMASGVPNTLNDLRRAQDPWMRQHYDLLHTIENKLPYLSEGLPPQRTLWGEAIPAKEGYAPFLTGTDAARMLSPIGVGRPVEDAQPIDKWIWDNRMAFPHGADNKTGLTRPGIFQNFTLGSHVSVQVELTPAQHDRLQVLAGNELKDPSTGLGARDSLNRLVEGTYPGSMQAQWDKATPSVQALIVQTMVNKFREAAKLAIRGEFPDLNDAIQAGAQQRAGQLTGQSQ